MGEAAAFQLEGSAPQQYERSVATIMAPFVAAIIERAMIDKAGGVLDVACGTGFVARAGGTVEWHHALSMMADTLRGALAARDAGDDRVTVPFTSVLGRGVR